MYTASTVQDSTSNLAFKVKQKASLKEKLCLANSKEDFAEQCTLLEQLAEYHLEQEGGYAEAAMLLNVALTIFNENQEKFLVGDLGARLSKKLQLLEVKYIIERIKVPYLKKETAPDYGVNWDYKKNLEDIRRECKEALGTWNNLDSKEKVEELQVYSQQITGQVVSLLGGMIQECIELMQVPPPCEYAIIGTGSLAREEMTFYSDLEYFILISENNEKNRQYFEHVSKLLELKIIQLGETDPSYNGDVLPKEMSNLIRKGFSLDVHKQAGNKENSLIGTPQELSRYQLPGETFIHRPGNHLSGALTTGILINCSNNGPALFEHYNELLQAIFDKGNDKQQPLRHERALFLIAEDINHFKTNLETVSELGRVLQVKNHLYRLPQTIMDGLALYYDLKSSSTWGRIELLLEQKRISEKAANKLRKLIALSVYWRLRTYSNYGAQRELIDVLQSLSASAFASYHSQNIGCSEQDLDDLTECYLILSNLEHSIWFFCQSEDKDSLLRQVTLNTEDGYYTRGLVALRLCQYPKAVVCFEKVRASISNKKDMQYTATIMELAYAHLTLGNGREAVKYYEELLTLLKSGPVNEEQQEKILKASYFLGIAWVKLYKSDPKPEYHQKAIDLFNFCLSGYIALLGEDHPRIAEVLSSIGERQAEEGDYEAAMDNFRKSLAITARMGDLDASVADNLNSMGFVLNKMQKPTEARPYLETSLKITRDLVGASHPNVAIILANLSSSFEQLGDLPLAIAMLNSAMSIDQNIYGGGHVTVVNAGFKLSQLLLNNNDVDMAIKLLNDLVKIAHQTNNHTKLAVCLNNLGAIYLNSGDPDNYDLALKCFKACKITQKKIYNDPDERIAKTNHNLAIVLRYKNQFKEALVNLEEELDIYTSLKKLEPEPMTGLISEILDVYLELENNVLALEFINKKAQPILQIMLLQYGANNPFISECKTKLEVVNTALTSNEVNSAVNANPNAANAVNVIPQYVNHLAANVHAGAGQAQQSMPPFQGSNSTESKNNRKGGQI